MALDKLTQITTSGINSTTPLSGINVTGIITASSLSVSGITTGAAATFDSVDVLGVLTYDDVTNVDALGIVTARSGVRVTGGSIGIGTDNPTKDLTITGNNPGILLKEDNANSELVLTVSDSDGTGVIAATRPSNYTYEQLAIRGQDLIFETTSTQSRVERLRVESGGNIGIGTNNANNLLHVYGGQIKAQSNPSDTSTNLDLIRAQCGSTGNALFSIRAADAADNNSDWDIKTNANENLKFSIGGDTERVRITSGGDVFINRTSQLSDAKLSVQADAGEPLIAAQMDTNSGISTVLQTFNSSGNVSSNISVDNANRSLILKGASTEGLRVSAGGYVLKSNHPCFDAVRNSGHLSSATYINYNTVKANNGGHYDSSNGRFTAPVAGYYFFSWGTIKNNDSATVARLHIHKNGVEAYGGRHLRMDSGQAYGDNGAMTVVIQLAKDDYIQIYLTAGSVYGVTEEYCFFNGYLLG